MFSIGVAQIKANKIPCENLEKIREKVVKSKERGIDILVFPEMTMGIFDSKTPPSLFSKEYSKFLSSICSIAKENKIDIICSLWEPSTQPKLPYNTAAFISREGKVNILYRKLHLFDSMGFNESNFILPGKTPPPVWDYHGLKFSLSICYDLRFPELYRYQAKMGAEISIVCSAWYGGILKEEHLQVLLQARAIENTMYIVCANQCGNNFCGRSAIFDPFGVKLADAGEEENIICCLISRNRIKKIRERLPCLKHLKEEIFNIEKKY